MLKDQLRDKALDMSEEHLKTLFVELIEIGELVVADTANPFDDVLVSTLKSFQSVVMDAIDKIDGKEG